MSAVAFDTHEFVKTLEAAGVPALQAEAISNAVKKAHESAELATKADLRELELSLTVKLGAIVVVALSVFSALLKWIA
ncbi:hypothetical protein [Collimonas pratensis]|uniref:DUF1640 domain-containing protein n=1 Tax=Collimonas pratensis TaxID=279113 RepID=A0ABM5ZB48_9BURK|nr:hypothetical protein [Collimonas pratensis]AMP16314.1 hypothetical protein CPter291_4081 [Collimonas pratensis]